MLGYALGMASGRRTSDYKLRWTYMGLTRMGGMGFLTPWAEIATMHHISVATGVPTPRYARTAPPADVLGVASRMTRALHRAPEFAAALFSDGFLVSPKAWPADIARLFPTDDPPTPYELATYILSRRGGAGRAGAGMDVISKMVLCWWLVGLPLAALDNRATLPLPVKSHLVDAIWSLVQRPVFRLWAVGDDLLPLMDSEQMEKSLPYVLGDLTGTTPDTRVYARYLHEAITSPYMRAIEARRAALRPRKRVLPDLPVTFATYEEKQSELMSRPAYWEALDRNRTKVLGAFGLDPIPDYASFTPIDVVWRSNEAQS